MSGARQQPSRARDEAPTSPRVAEVEVLAEIARIAREELELERPLTLDDRDEADLGTLRETTLAALALDSVARTVLAVALEDRFRVRLEEADANVATVGELARIVAARASESPDAEDPERNEDA